MVSLVAVSASFCCLSLQEHFKCLELQHIKRGQSLNSSLRILDLLGPRVTKTDLLRARRFFVKVFGFHFFKEDKHPAWLSFSPWVCLCLWLWFGSQHSGSCLMSSQIVVIDTVCDLSMFMPSWLPSCYFTLASPVFACMFVQELLHLLSLFWLLLFLRASHNVFIKPTEISE